MSPMLARFIKPVLKVLGMTHPVLQWMVAPVVVFIIVLAVFKGFGFLAHRKVEVFYKYKAGDLRLALWERLNSRVGRVPFTRMALTDRVRPTKEWKLWHK